MRDFGLAKVWNLRKDFLKAGSFGHKFFSPKGWDKITQGNALGKRSPEENVEP